MTIAEGLINLLWDFRDENGLSIRNILMDTVEGKPEALSVSPSSDHTLKRYLNGDEVRESNFEVYLKAYTSENINRIQNTQLVDKMKEWINHQSKIRNFPAIGEHRTCKKMEANNGMMYENNTSGEGLYLLQVKITYYEKMGGKEL